MCWSLFLIKLHAFRHSIFLKRDSNTGISCEYSKSFKNFFFTEQLLASASDKTEAYLGFCQTSMIEKIVDG